MNHTKSGSKFTELILETFRLNGVLIEAGDKLISDLGLTSARWQVLGNLMGGSITVAEIARKMGLARQNVQRISNRLEQGGFTSFSSVGFFSSGALGQFQRFLNPLHARQPHSMHHPHLDILP